MKLPELTEIELGEPWKLGDDKQGIAVPILQKERVDRNYVLHTEVEGKIQLIDTGGIHRLKIKNGYDGNVFIRRGTMLKGKTQHRAVVSSIVVAPLEETSAEIRCIFASKGISSGATFKSAGYSPRKVMANLHNDQSRVWASVSSYTQGLSATYSDLGVSEQINYLSGGRVRGDDLTSHVEIVEDAVLYALKNVPADVVNQIGVIILDLQGVEGVELFDHPDSWKALSKSVIRDYADILSKPAPEYFTFDMNKVKEYVVDFLVKFLGIKAEPVWEQFDAQTFQFEDEKILGEYTNLEGNLIHLYATRKEKGSYFKPKPSITLRSPISTPDWYRDTTDYSQPLTWQTTATPTANLDPTDSMMEGVMRYATQKRGNETLQSLYSQSKSFTEIQSDTSMSPSTVSKALKEGEELGLIERAYRSGNGKSVYKLTSLGKKVNPKKFMV